jgi:hypothetical protein
MRVDFAFLFWHFSSSFEFFGFEKKKVISDEFLFTLIKWLNLS